MMPMSAMVKHRWRICARLRQSGNACGGRHAAAAARLDVKN